MFVDYDEIIDVPTASCAIDILSELAHNDPTGNIPSSPGGTVNNLNETEGTLVNESINGAVRHSTDVPIIISSNNDESVNNPTIRKEPPAKEQ